MTETLLSVGIDLGTTTTQMIVSRLHVENTASTFSVPHIEIGEREILYRSQIHFTPLLTDDTLDAEAIQKIIGEEYRCAGIQPEMVQTGAVIITGETAQAVLAALSEYAGKFVVATAGPALESVLAAKGAGADKYAREHRCWVLHMDIGGGTSNLALFDPDGILIDTGCLNVGGRLLKFDQNGTVLYRSPVLNGMNSPRTGERATPEGLKPLIDQLVQVLEECAGLRDPQMLNKFVTDRTVTLPNEPLMISFSGGVAELLRSGEPDWLRYGDIGVMLANGIRASKLCQNKYVLGQETVQATVIGAGIHSTELSGSTVSYFNAEFPLQDLPVIEIPSESEPTASRVIREKKQRFSDGPVAIALQGSKSPSYAHLEQLADEISSGVGTEECPVVVVLREDMGKALGQALRVRLGDRASLLCLDGLTLHEGSYLDIGAPVGDGTVVPVVIKTLTFM